jgi:nicotinate (nicotinamide) nucleotide adenylyltransferase
MIKENNITIMGGSFNPVHSGHIEMVKAAHTEYGLDNIVFMPNKSTYYKDNKAFADDEDRVNMIKLAIKDYPYMSISDMEIRRGGVTHTIDTIRELKAEDPSRKIYFIIGGDSLEWIEKWVDADELLGSVTFLTAVRGKTDRNRSRDIIRDIYTRHSDAAILLLNMEECDISSTDIRERVSRGEEITDLVPAEVADYIAEHKLYKEKNDAV